VGAFHQQKTFAAPLLKRGPRMELGRYTVMPLEDDAGNVIADKWVLPGRRVLTTRQCQEIAARNEWPIHILVN